MKANKEIRLEVKEAIDQVLDIDPNTRLSELLDVYSLNQVLHLMALQYHFKKENKAEHLCKVFAKQSLEIIY